MLQNMKLIQELDNIFKEAEVDNKKQLSNAKLADISLKITEEWLTGFDENGYSPVALAMYKGHSPETATYLISKMPDPDFPITINKSSSLIVAADSGMDSIIKNLIDKGANVNFQNIHGAAAITYAAAKGDTQIAKFLIENKANVNLLDNEDTSPLAYAAKVGKTEIISLLLEHKAEVNLLNKYGNIPLMYAAQGGYDKAVNLLCSQGANVNARNNDGNTALMFAASNGHMETIKSLLINHADLNVKNNKGLTAAMYLAKYQLSRKENIINKHEQNVGANNEKTWVEKIRSQKQNAVSKTSTKML